MYDAFVILFHEVSIDIKLMKSITTDGYPFMVYVCSKIFFVNLSHLHFR